MKDAVQDGTDDITLAHLVEITKASLIEDRPLFATLLEEPSFYRKYFKLWVQEAVAEKNEMDKMVSDAMDTAKSLLQE